MSIVVYEELRTLLAIRVLVHTGFLVAIMRQNSEVRHYVDELLTYAKRRNNQGEQKTKFNVKAPNACFPFCFCFLTF